jgi:hydroxyacylglutathione hydrolase
MMIVKRFFEASIAQASYLIGCASSGEALVIDANRDVDDYIAAAARDQLRIAHVTETHIHADYVSGSRELARRTGAALYLSDEGDADWKYRFIAEGRPLRHGDRFTVGRIVVEAVHTPGHTPEHLTFLITDGAAADRPIAAATGDFLFVGDVGRPDLLERAANIKGTMEQSARRLWASLQAFARREDWLQIWPGHGAGSACGKGISAVPQSTLGYEKLFNWAFQAKGEEDFVRQVLAGQPEPPKYFAMMKTINKAGPPIIGERRAPATLDDDRLADVLAAGALVVDTRAAHRYAARHVRGTLNIPLNGSFVTWAGWLLPYDAPFHLILDDAADPGAAARLLALIGLDRISGCFRERAIDAAQARGAEVGEIGQMAVDELEAKLAGGGATVIDVRAASEWQAGHLPGARHIPLGYLSDRAPDIPAGPVVVHCQLGGRSAIAASLLGRLGRSQVANLTGGFAAWHAAGFPVEKDDAHEQKAAHA